MEKKSILALSFLFAFTTFASSQDVAHTPPTIDYKTYRAFDDGFMQRLLAENPSLIFSWNSGPRLYWHSSFLFPSMEPTVNSTFTTPVYNMDSYELFIFEQEQKIIRSSTPGNLNSFDCPQTDAALFWSLKVLANYINRE